MPALHLVRHGQASFGAADYDRLSPLGVEQSRAAGAALRARGVTPAVVVHGALRRQRETAEALAGAWAESPAGVPPLREDARWAEYDHEALLTRLHEARGPTPADDGAARSADVAGGATAGRGPDGPEPPADPRAAFQEALERALGRWTAGGHDADYAESFGAYRTRVAAALDAAVAAAAGPPTARRSMPTHPGSASATYDGPIATRPGPVVVVSSAGTIAAVVADLLGLEPEAWAALNRVAVNASITTVVAGRRGRSLVSFNEHGHLGGPGRPERTTR